MASNGIASHTLNAIMMPVRANIAAPPGIVAQTPQAPSRTPHAGD
jgi:hypothetical protein